MVEYQTQLDSVFAALADPTRRAILAHLANGTATVGELAAPFDMSLQSVSKHLKVLEQAGLVSRSVEGRVHHLTARPERLESAMAWVQWYRSMWDRSLDRLEHFLESPEASGDLGLAWHTGQPGDAS